MVTTTMLSHFVFMSSEATQLLVARGTKLSANQGSGHMHCSLDKMANQQPEPVPNHEQLASYGLLTMSCANGASEADDASSNQRSGSSSYVSSYVSLMAGVSKITPGLCWSTS